MWRPLGEEVKSMVEVEEQLYTDTEARIYEYLIGHRIAFQFRTSLSGGLLSEALVPFLIEPNLAWRVMIEPTGLDIIQREILSNLGYAVDLREYDIINRLAETMKLALSGQEVLH